MAGTLLVLVFMEQGSQTAELASNTVFVLALLVTTPLISIVLVLLYYDLRIRKEGFDLELLSQSLHPDRPRAGPEPPPGILGLP